MARKSYTWKAQAQAKREEEKRREGHGNRCCNLCCPVWLDAPNRQGRGQDTPAILYSSSSSSSSRSRSRSSNNNSKRNKLYN